MSKLASVPYVKQSSRMTQMRFDGLERREGATDGAICEMQNMTGANYPILQPRGARELERVIENANGIYYHEALLWVSGTELWYGENLIGYVQDSKKIFTAMGNRIAIWPDKVIFNASYPRLGTFETLDALKQGVSEPKEFDAYGVGDGVPYEIYVWNGSEWVSNGLELSPIEASVHATKVKFQSGTFEGEDTDANTVYCAGISWADYFREGDAVTISGCTEHPENNKTPIVREIDGAYLRFYENTFVLDGDDGLTAYTEPGTITFARTAPELTSICANDNRLFGVADDTVYASALGDPYNWNKFEGLASDSYFVESGTAGAFTGCASYLGYPTFFKENRVLKLYGAKPQNFALQASASVGVQEGSGQSLAIAADILFYLSPNGAQQYTGGMPERISDALGNMRLQKAVGGSDGENWYISALDEDGRSVLLKFDAVHGSWWKEDDLRAEQFCRTPQGLLALEAGTGKVWRINCGESPEQGVRSWVQFSDFTDGTLDRKSIEKILFRFSLAPRAQVAVLIQYDNQRTWQTIAKLSADDTQRSVNVPVLPRRCDRYRLRIEGEGLWKLFAMAREVKQKSGRG